MFLPRSLQRSPPRPSAGVKGRWVPLQVIYDLLIEKPSALELREDPAQGVQVAGLTRVRVETVEEIMVKSLTLVQGQKCDR